MLCLRNNYCIVVTKLGEACCKFFKGVNINFSGLECEIINTLNFVSKFITVSSSNIHAVY